MQQFYSIQFNLAYIKLLKAQSLYFLTLCFQFLNYSYEFQMFKYKQRQVQIKNIKRSKYRIQDDQIFMHSSFDSKIGVTRLPQPKKSLIKPYMNYSLDNKTPTKQKRTGFSTSKMSSKKKIQQFKLPTIKKPTITKLFVNPQVQTAYKKASKDKSFSALTPKSPHNKIYYQSLVHKSHNTNSNLAQNYLTSLAKQHFLQTIQALKYGKKNKHKLLNNSLKDSENIVKPLNLPKKNPSFKTVFLDLDQTLIHCDQSSNNYTVKLDFPIQGTNQIIQAGIRVRPHCQQFLQELSSLAQIIIFTASTASYADVVLDYLDPKNKYFSHRLYRHHCVLDKEKGIYTKDLRVINRRIEDIVLVDNSGYCFMLQPFNGIPIVPFYHYGKDNQLKDLIKFLKKLLTQEDVRVQVKNTFFWHKYLDNEGDPRDILQENYKSQFSMINDGLK